MNQRNKDTLETNFMRNLTAKYTATRPAKPKIPPVTAGKIEAYSREAVETSAVSTTISGTAAFTFETKRARSIKHGVKK